MLRIPFVNQIVVNQPHFVVNALRYIKNEGVKMKSQLRHR